MKFVAIKLLGVQQAKVVGKHTDLKVGSYTGDMNVDAWKLQTWEQEMEKCEVCLFSLH